MEKQMGFDDLEDVNLDLIKNEPWALEMWDYLSKGFQKSFLHWCKYVTILSDEPTSITHWADIYKKEFESFVCDFVCDVSSLNDKVLTQAEELMAELQELCRELRIEMPVLGSQKLGLYEEVKQLQAKIGELKVLCEGRKGEVKKLLDQQSKLCTSLGKTPRYLSKTSLPSQEELESLRTFIEGLEREKYEREELFVEKKIKILEIVEEIDYKALSEFEIEVLSNEDDRFLVTDQNMKLLDEFHKNLIQRKVEMSEEISEKWAKIEGLWSVLETDLGERARFNDDSSGKTSEVLKKLNEEIKRLELIKKENIRVFIEKYRNKLINLWDICHISPENADFIYFHSDCYTEDFLDLFELEIKKWTKYYEENKHLLKLIDEYHKCWNKVIELDEKSKGPNRYKNRGGQLLMEEKERNKLNKRIPLIEEELKSLSSKYTENTGQIFMTWGKTIPELIEGLYADREAERKLRISAHKQQREKTMLTPGKSCTQLFPGTTPKAKQTLNTKRKILTTPMTQIKKPKIESRLVKSEAKRRRSGIKNIRRSRDSNRTKRRSGKKAPNKENVVVSDYDEFQNRPLAFSSTIFEPIIEDGTSE